QGAKVLFAPISQFDGQPDETRAITAPGVSPIEIKLAPGEYWVEAVLPGGRFQEVIRTVPRRGNIQLEADPAMRKGPILLSAITIPEQGLEAGMLRVQDGGGPPFFVDLKVLTKADRSS